MGILGEGIIIGKLSFIRPSFSAEKHFSASDVHPSPLRRALNLPLDVSLSVWSLGNSLVSAWTSAEGGAVVSNKQGGVLGRELNWPSKDLPSVTD